MGDGEGGDADLEAVGGGAAVVGVVLHVPEVAELVLGAGGGAAGLGPLHGEAGHHQALDEVADGGGVAGGGRRGRCRARGEGGFGRGSQAVGSMGSMPRASATIQSAPAVILARRSA